ncbi:MAG: hypothetical protein ACYC00_08615 [Eubacteriales bacterium]
MMYEKIKHTIFGKGTVISIEDNYMTILFDNSKYGEKVFVYPNSFEHFLSFDNSTLQEQTSDALKLKQKKAQEEKAQDAAVYKKHQDDITEARLEFTKKRTPVAKPKAEMKIKISRAKIKKSVDGAVK